jgi:NTE family protein
MTPVVIHGRLLADGGLLNPLPIAPTVTAGADVTVAVAVSGQHRTSAVATDAAARPGNGYRGDVVRRTANYVLDNDVLRGIGMRLTALRSAPPGRTAQEIVEEATETVLEALPAGLRTLDVMELSLEAVRTAIMRHTLADHPPDVLITVPRSSCRTLDFHRADEMIGLGRLLAVEALDREEDRSPICAVR